MRLPRLILFTLAVPVIFFVVLELLLALFGVTPLLLTQDPLVGFSSGVPLFVEDKSDNGTPIYRTADNKLALFNYQEFPQDKGSNTYRIFCLGGSTTYGRPFTNKVSFCGWLGDFLNAAQPGRNWEVINAGGASYASYRVAKLMQELIRYQPDMFIIYSGQNEFLEERSYGGLADLPYWVIEADSLLNGTRTYSSLKRLYNSLRPDSLQHARKRYEMSGEVDEILGATLGPTNYHRDDTLKQQIKKHYRLNLERMVRIARGAGAEVILVNPAVNLKDMSPFKSEHKAGLAEDELREWQQLVNQAIPLHHEDKFSEALARYREALRLDDRYAELHFQIGRALFSLKRYDEAERSFWRAVQEDVAPLRILPSMRDIVASVARARDVPLLDFQKILKQAYTQKKYPYAVLGKEFFLDHVHTNIEGYRLLGLDLFLELRRLGIVAPASSLSKDQVTAVTEQIMSTITFRENGEALLQLGKVLDWAGKFEEAKNLFRRVEELFGPQGETSALLGKIYGKDNDAPIAIHYLKQALSLGFEEPWMYGVLGDMYGIQGNLDKAIKSYQHQLKLEDNDPVTHFSLGNIYLYQGKNDLAREHFTAALTLKPDFMQAEVNIMSLFFVEQNFDEALDLGMKILNKYPDEPRTHYVVGSILLEQGKKKEAIGHFQEALRVAPNFRQAQEALKKATR